MFLRRGDIWNFLGGSLPQGKGTENVAVASVVFYCFAGGSLNIGFKTFVQKVQQVIIQFVPVRRNMISTTS